MVKKQLAHFFNVIFLIKKAPLSVVGIFLNFLIATGKRHIIETYIETEMTN